jgi:hypothetical protein
MAISADSVSWRSATHSREPLSGALVANRGEFVGSLPTTFGELLFSHAIVRGGGILLGQLVGSSAPARRMLLPSVP